MSKTFLLGQLFAMLEGTGVVPSEKIPEIATCPAKFVGQAIAEAMRSPHYAAIEGDVAKILAKFSTEDFTAQNDAAEAGRQTDFFLGYYSKKQKRKPGAPLAGQRIDWSTVDFSRGDAVLARELGVAPQSVRFQRLKRTAEAAEKASAPE